MKKTIIDKTAMNDKYREDWVEAFLNACKNGLIEEVKMLSTNVAYDRVITRELLNQGFLQACQGGHLNIIEWLCESQEMKSKQQYIGCWGGFVNLHAHKERGFILACAFGRENVLRWFLFEKRYEPLKGKIGKLPWRQWLKSGGYEEALVMVIARDEEKELKNVPREKIEIEENKESVDMDLKKHKRL